ncbi:MAG: hypothetical protein ACFB0B_07160, partial [Thermonemataceae bacterium]
RASIPLNIVTGPLSPAEGKAKRYYDRASKEIEERISAASVMCAIRDSRIGFLGHTYAGMLDMYSDPTMFHAQLGNHIEILEMDDLQVRVDQVLPEEADKKIQEIKDVFQIAEPGFD